MKRRKEWLVVNLHINEVGPDFSHDEASDARLCGNIRLRFSHFHFNEYQKFLPIVARLFFACLAAATFLLFTMWIFITFDFYLRNWNFHASSADWRTEKESFREISWYDDFLIAAVGLIVMKCRWALLKFSLRATRKSNPLWAERSISVIEWMHWTWIDRRFLWLIAIYDVLQIINWELIDTHWGHAVFTLLLREFGRTMSIN